MRRIKMLEYALRMERSKQLTQPPPTSQLPPAKLAAIQALTSQKDDSQSNKEGSSGSSPRSEDSPLPDARVNGVASAGRPMSWGANGPSSATVAGLGKPPPGRDPKSRARSRDYLKQCLQEISYLTSPQAMNPLPNRPLLNNGNMPLVLPNCPEFPMLNGNMNLMSGPSSAPAGSQMHNLERSNPMGSGILQLQHMQQPPQQSSPNMSMMQQNIVPSQTPPLLNSERDGDSEPRQLTAIFRPDDAGEWKEKLRLSHEASEQARFARENQHGWDRRSDDDDGKDEDGEVDDDETNVVSDGEGNKVWRSKRTLRKCVAVIFWLYAALILEPVTWMPFGLSPFHPHELSLATGGDDCTVKIWRMDVAGLASSASRPTTEIEPQLTLRGHSAAITRLIHAPSKGLLYSASLDSSIRVAHWHTDAVWDLALVRDESTLISCGAEGTVKVWDVSGPSGGGSLKLTWGWAGLESSDELQEDMDAPGATAVEALRADLKKVAVAYQNAVVKIFDIENGKELTRLGTDISYDGTPATQINRIVSHPTMPLLVTAHEDKYIRIFDIVTGQCTHSMLAHLDGVTSLSIDPAGFSLVSGSHDCSVRFWDLLGSHICVQEVTTHREKAREGVLDTEFHPSLPFMASAGADGVVKLYASS
ncbi:striatin-related protein [Mycena amicta]|nr:striatin-related protein [Mycena amicta]